MNARHERGNLGPRHISGGRSWARVLSVGVASTVVATIGLAAAAPSNAAETYPRPLDGTIKLSGHGFGHGHGMSQWGAYGAASVGKLSWKSIVSFYYPGTVLSTQANSTIRVRLDAVGHGALSLPTPSGLTLAGTALPATLAGLPVTAYRVSSRTAGGVRLDALSSAGWTLYRNLASAAILTNPSHGNVVDVQQAGGSKRSYRGSIVVNGVTSTSITTVSVLPMETYLRSVVPAEMPASWHPNAVASQAVAARSYASYFRANTPAGSLSDTCDNTFCQTYSGVQSEHAASDAAVLATAGQTLTYAGKAALTEFGAANGGWTAAGGPAYLAATADPYDGAIPNGANTWSKSVTAASIQSRWPSIGTYRQLRIISRDGHGQWGGRVLTAAVDGSAGSVTVSGTTFAYAFGLMSEWFVPTSPAAAPAPVTVPQTPAYAVTPYTPYKAVTLAQGATGAAVVVLQRGLKLTADGEFGPMTAAAVMAFQKQQGLLSNGIVSRAVWDGLEKRDYPLIAYRALTQQEGSTGPVTVVIQRALRLTADGVFGPKTAAAVKTVQGQAKLAQTGVVSGWTWVAIEAQMPR
jgi:stage II sporulation protein D